MQGVPSRHPAGVVAMCSGDLTRYALSMQCFMALQVPPKSVNAWNVGMLIARSLNGALRTCFDNPDYKWVWIMGDDHSYSPDTLLRLLDREVDVVAPLCLNRLPPMDPTIVEHNHEPTGRMKYLEDLPAGGLYKLTKDETCGDAGLLIRRNVLEAIPAPWYDHRISGAIAAEDQAFVQRMKDAGFDIHIDLDVQIGHIGSVEYKPVLKDGKWEVRMTGGGMRHICDMAPFPRSPDMFRMPSE